MSKKLWGGRFKKKTNPLVEEFTKSIHYDHKLAIFDIMGSLLHVKVLKEADYLSVQEARKLTTALKAMQKNALQGFKYDKNCEDVHTNIQNLLEKKVGALALKLQTARSRNEQVVIATKYYCQSEISQLRNDVTGLSEALNELGKKNKDVIIPGFTHMQHAQPVYLRNYLQAYCEMLDRDWWRLNTIQKFLRIYVGAGALAGTPIGYRKYEKAIGALGPLNHPDYYLDDYECYEESVINSLDAVSDRDFVIEIIAALAILAMHLSRLAEDFIIWSTKEFDFVEIDESFCTGSSLMPQKKNPDILEFIRGYAGRLNGNLVSVLTMMKGLPLTYNRDMQLDKEPLFDSFEIVSKELKVLKGVVETLTVNEEKIKEHLKDESLYATDLVYYLVQKGITFKNAHDIIGRLIRYSLDASTEIKKMSEKTLKKFSNKIVRHEFVKLFDSKVSVESKKSIGVAIDYQLRQFMKKQHIRQLLEKEKQRK